MNKIRTEVDIHTIKHTTETILVKEEEKQASMVVCEVEAPERIEWTMKINESSISGRKTTGSGNVMRIIFDINLCEPEKVSGEGLER